jgi:nucleoside-diphosphate-sugar epimerase
MTPTWEGRSCLVTGGLGFGGSHLVAELLARSSQVVVLDHGTITSSYLHQIGLSNSITVVHGDVREGYLVKEVIRRHAVDTVFHLAAQPLIGESVANPFETLDINTRGTFVLLEMCRRESSVQRFVLASSGAFYGPTTTTDPIPETAAPLPAPNLYSSSKAGADLAVQGYVKTFGMRATVCRFMNTYGPGDRHTSRLVPRGLQLLGSNAEYNFGDRDDGSTRLDFLYVGDMALAYIAVAEHLDRSEGDVFNFGSGRSNSVREVATTLSRTFDGAAREPIFQGVPNHPCRHKWLDIQKAQTVLGWKPQVTLEEGLARTVEWYRDVRTARRI